MGLAWLSTGGEDSLIVSALRKNAPFLKKDQIFYFPVVKFLQLSGRSVFRSRSWSSEGNQCNRLRLP